MKIAHTNQPSSRLHRSFTPVKCYLCQRQRKSIDHFKDHYKREHYAKDPSAQIHHTPLDDSYGTPLDKFYELEPGASVRTVACVGLTLILFGLAGTLLLQLEKASSHFPMFLTQCLKNHHCRPMLKKEERQNKGDPRNAILVFILWFHEEDLQDLVRQSRNQDMEIVGRAGSEERNYVCSTCGKTWNP